MSGDKEIDLYNDNGDPTIEYLVELCNTAGYTFSVTLSIKGSIVTGKIIGRKQYFEEMSHLFERDGLEVIAEGYKEFSKVFDAEEDLEEDMKTPYHIHLKDAKYVSSNGLFPQNGMMWRGRIKEIDGFSLGNLTTRN
ncbi:gas vesicle accessory protein GvpU [Salipaludibacillus sp. HK11]|uniref:gas vesicle accessory protein GvpU n=1 Tax=Salipaludibacillus sp. HK11 TaxID=3394320 RepID=UPI0039FC50CB